MKTTINTLTLPGLLLAVAVLASGCHKADTSANPNMGPAQAAGKAVDDSAAHAAEATREAGARTEAAAQRAGEDVRDAAHQSAEAARDATANVRADAHAAAQDAKQAANDATDAAGKKLERAGQKMQDASK